MAARRLRGPRSSTACLRTWTAPLEAEHDAGDHTIAVGRVLDIEVLDGERGPLLFFRGAYGHFAGSAAAP